MTRITVLGGTGYAGAAVVAEAAARRHEVTAFSRSAPATPIEGVSYVQGSAEDEAALRQAIQGAQVVVAALSPRGELAGRLRPIYRTVARLAAEAGAKLYVVGGFTALRPAPGAPRLIEAEQPPEQIRAEVEAMAAVLTEDLPEAPAALDWVYVSPANQFGAFAPGERRGHYRLGDEVALYDEDGVSAISGADYALALVDLIERDDQHRVQVGVAY